MKRLMFAMTLLALGACSWVKPTTQSHQVVLAEQNQVVNCVKKGSTTSKTLSKITVVPRSNDKVFSELVMLAKNEAAILGGDTIVAEGTINAGSQVFGVYRCR